MSTLLPSMLAITSLLTAMLDSPASLAFFVWALSLPLALSLAFLQNTWMALMFLLIFVGGFMVLFAYFMITGPNHLLSNSTLMSFLFLGTMITAHKMSTTNSLSTLVQPPASNLFSFFYHPLTAPLLVLAALLLFMAMIYAAKIISKSQNPMR